MWVEEVLLKEGREVFETSGSVPSFLTSEFKARLFEYLLRFEQIRKDEGCEIEDHDLMKGLPHSMMKESKDWVWRARSLDVVMSFVEKPVESGLEIGAWNGWLSRHLTSKVERLVCTDYFVNPSDGIGAIKPSESIVPLQIDSTNIPNLFKPESFDVIVLNHCLHFIDNPVQYVHNLKKLLKPNGRIISVGNTFYKNPSNKKESFEAARAEFKSKHGIEMLVNPSKGYLDVDDRIGFIDEGCEIKEYESKKLANVAAKVLPSRPLYCSITFQNK